ncbi:orotate phosphoribosyltransferase [Ligilactobacillus salitolerans]|uniref:Orotate phosphoribosyltransferase n=1 Tax=Ligilactobacillus salitolerans TaxID=1808352 RepID=A0A401IWD0_9LACO|nr:orotate phosphoribosyltransferase [Ligilactobacillus salitolerans]GBG95818.1 orotate phosphoribosyltransferase [Ligilactobacillus salitolerans]
MKKIAAELLEINAVKLAPKEPFIWASGIKSPIYCDNRLTISYPAVRNEIAAGLAQLITKYYPDTELIAGTATAGIPHAAWVAQILDLPMIYIRSAPKDHGKGRQIEGVAAAGQKTVVIDDLLSTGGSVLRAVHAVQKEKIDVLGVVGIFNYELPSLAENFKVNKLSYHTLTNFSELLEQAQLEQTFTSEEIASMASWKKDPAAWMS